MPRGKEVDSPTMTLEVEDILARRALLDCGSVDGLFKAEADSCSHQFEPESPSLDSLISHFGNRRIARSLANSFILVISRCLLSIHVSVGLRLCSVLYCQSSLFG